MAARSAGRAHTCTCNITGASNMEQLCHQFIIRAAIRICSAFTAPHVPGSCGVRLRGLRGQSNKLYKSYNMMHVRSQQQRQCLDISVARSVHMCRALERKGSSVVEVTVVSSCNSRILHTLFACRCSTSGCMATKLPAHHDACQRGYRGGRCWQQLPVSQHTTLLLLLLLHVLQLSLLAVHHIMQLGCHMRPTHTHADTVGGTGHSPSMSARCTSGRPNSDCLNRPCSQGCIGSHRRCACVTCVACT